jgi:hypothetical protein
MMTALLLLTMLADSAAELPTLRCTPATQPIVIDGRLDDDAWATAEWTSHFVPLVTATGQPFEVPQTRAKFLYGNTHLYVAAEMVETDVRARMQGHDDALFRDNAFELFVDPDDDGANYLELEANALGTTFDLIMSKPYDKKGKADASYEIEGLRCAVHVDGTLNEPTDTDRNWTIELAIPWASIRTLAKEGAIPPKPGERWRMNLARVMSPRDKSQRTRYATWSPINGKSLHAPDRWGWLEFTASRADTPGPASGPSFQTPR